MQFYKWVNMYLFALSPQKYPQVFLGFSTNKNILY